VEGRPVPGLGNTTGFLNLGTSFKYQIVSDAEGELAMSSALVVDWGGTGSRVVDAAPFTTLTQTWYADRRGGVGDPTPFLPTGGTQGGHHGCG
jgi:hypothetical protein